MSVTTLFKGKGKKYIIFCPIHETSLNAMLPIAHYIKQEMQCTPIFLLGSPNMFGYRQQIVREGFQEVSVEPLRWRGTRQLHVRLRHKLSMLIRKWVLSGCFLPSVIFKASDEFYQRLVKYYIDIIPILLHFQPVSVVFPDDRVLGFGLLPALSKACTELKILRIVLPVSYAGDERRLGEMPNRKKQCIVSIENKIFKKYPNNLLLNKGCQYATSFYDPITTEILYRFGELPENPWVMGGGFSDLIMVEGQETAQRYIKYGCKSSKIRVTGHASHDNLFFKVNRKLEIRRHLYHKYGVGRGKLNILALPQLGEHKLLSWKDHWYEVNFLCKVFSEEGCNTLISLHPKMKKEQYNFITLKYGIPIADESLHDILPVADNFFSIYSSTVEWATICKIPVVVFDFYDFNNDMFDDYKGVVVTKNREELLFLLKRLQKDSSYWLNLSNAHKEKSFKLSPFDGKCMKRIAQQCC